MSRLRTKSNHRDNAEQSGNREHNQVGKFEWRLGLRGCKGVQRRNLLERLHDQHEKIEIKTDHRADDVDPTPTPGQILPIARENGQGQKWQRDNSETDRGCETVKWKE